MRRSRRSTESGSEGEGDDEGGASESSAPLVAARGLFRGALLVALGAESDQSRRRSSIKRERAEPEPESAGGTTDDEEGRGGESKVDDNGSGGASAKKRRRPNASKQKSAVKSNGGDRGEREGGGGGGGALGSYVMKLHDRSVDLARFAEAAPLYPIIRAWMANDPRGLKTERTFRRAESDPNGVKLPPPEGPIVSRVPPLVEEQLLPSKDRVEAVLESDDGPSPIDDLLKNHLKRWHAIRKKWYDQSVLHEKRYAKTQEILTEMDTNNS